MNNNITELMINFLSIYNLTTIKINLELNTIEKYKLHFKAKGTNSISVHCHTNETRNNWFFIFKEGIEDDILFKEILKKDNIFKEELISILEKELLNEN